MKFGAVYIELTDQEIFAAAAGGVRRNLSAIRDRRTDGTKAQPGDKWGHHVLGAIGEFGVSRLFGVPWDPAVGQIDKIDLEGMEIRTTGYARGKLILQGPNRSSKGDNPKSTFFLACLVETRLWLVGWLVGIDGMQDQYWKEDDRGHGAWWVPQRDLHAMPTFKHEWLKQPLRSILP